MSPQNNQFTKDSHKSLPPTIYRIWQKFFSSQKLAPLLNDNQFMSSGRVLELGCGPGTNRIFFPYDIDYVGVDIDPAAVKTASNRTTGEFICADFVNDELPEGPFDAILIHSTLHHLSDHSSLRIIGRLKQLLNEGGAVYIIDAIKPLNIGIPLLLAKMDRGKYFRNKEQWKKIFLGSLETLIYEEFDLNIYGINCYKMFYLKGIPLGTFNNG